MSVRLADLSDVQIVGLTLFGEARGEGPEGRIAVANVIKNRVAAGRFGNTLRGVCLQPHQFSCWEDIGGKANHGLLLDTASHLRDGGTPGPLLRECLWIAQGALDAAFVDSTRGSTHYLTDTLYAEHPPAWARGQRILAHIGKHLFLRVA